MRSRSGTTATTRWRQFARGRFLSRFQVENLPVANLIGINLFTSSLELAKFRFWNRFKNRLMLSSSLSQPFLTGISETVPHIFTLGKLCRVLGIFVIMSPRYH
jgi:hypothetical protein